MSALKLIFNLISNGSSEQMPAYLDKIPVEKMSPDKSDQLLAILLDKIYAAKHQHRELMMRLVLFRWANLDPKTKEEVEGESLTVFESLFFNDRISLANLKWIASLYPTESLYKILLDVTEYDFNNGRNYSTPFGLKRIFNVYDGSYTRDEIESIHNKAFEVGNNTLYLHTRIILETKFITYAPKPVWIVTPKELQTEAQLRKNLKPRKRKEYTLDEMINLMQKYSKGIDITNLKEIRTKMSNLSYSDRLNLVRPFIKEETGVIVNLFQLYGPSNRYPFPDSDDLRNYRDRMLQCDYFEVDPLTGETQGYKGVCWQCSYHIRHKWYAVRAPLLGGGWKGWFCNWKCVTEWLNIVYEVNLSDEEELLKLAELVRRMKELVLKYGIIDRLES